MKYLYFIFLVFITTKDKFKKNNIDIDLIIDKVIQILPGMDTFDIFKFSSEIKNDTLLIYRIVDFALNNLIGKNIKNQIIDKKQLNKFLLSLSEQYNLNSYQNMNSYHNIFHASDVVHNLYIYLIQSKKYNPILFTDTYKKENEELELISNINYKDLDLFALIIAAACHDFKHTGRNNNFYLNYKDKVPFAKILKEYEYKLEYYHYIEAKKLIEKFE